MKTIFEDERLIRSVFWPLPEGANITVGENGVSEILPYKEPGQMARVTWLAVFQKGRISQRINTAHIDTIVYD